MAELLGQFGVEEVAALGEGLEGVGVEDGGPSVAVVAGVIASGEDVLEVGAAVAADNLGDEADFLHVLFLEGHWVYVLLLLDGIVVHVEQGGGEELGGHETLAIGLGGGNLLDEFVWDGLAGLVVVGIHLHHLRVAAPVLHHL